MNIELKERSRDDLLEIISAKDMKITMQKIEIEETKEEIERLHSIIKEVREYITKQVHRNQQFYEMDIDNILEILDKVGDEK